MTDLPTSRTNRSTPFTLIELLVVVTIIAILASLLLPALSSAREKAKSSVCQSHLRQMHLLMNLYSSNFDGWLPGSTFKNEPHMTTLSWYDSTSTSWSQTLIRTNAYYEPENWQSEGKVFFCPASQAYQSFTRARTPATTYIMTNNYNRIWNNPKRATGGKLEQFESGATLANDWVIDPVPNPGVYVTNHRNGGNVLETSGSVTYRNLGEFSIGKGNTTSFNPSDPGHYIYNPVAVMQ